MMAAQLLGHRRSRNIAAFLGRDGTHINRRCRPAARASGCLRGGRVCQRRAGFFIRVFEATDRT